MHAPCRIELFGGLRVEQGERSITRFQTQKTATLLAFLAFHLHKNSHPRELLIELLWPEVEPRTGRHRLSMSLSSLRRQLEPPGIPSGAVLQADRFHVRLNPEAVVTDVAEFEAAQHNIPTPEQGGQAVPALQRAIDLYRGPLLPGFYEDWIVREQERLNEVYRQTIHRLIGELEDAGDWQQAMEYARRAVNDDPLREEGHQELIRLLAEDGQSTAALRQYEELERLLQQELGQRPSEATRALVEQPGRVRQKGHGHRRRRPLPPAVPSALVTLNVRTPEPANIALPLQFTRFFGREEEVARLVEMLAPAPASSGHFAHFVTLSGTGGSGKTRLAIEVARRLGKAFAGGVWFVPLADLRDAGLIAGAVLEALNLPRASNMEPLEQVIGFLVGRGMPTLLVLDNFEHLVEKGASLIRDLLDRAVSLTCLVTSRQLLNLEGEQEFAVSPLPIPHGSEILERISRVPSVELFVDRAQAIRPDFQLTSQNAPAIAALCARLEGFPLAIQLAAARIQVLTPAQMVCQLDQRFDFLVSRRRDAIDRHRTLRAAIDWSYRLLSPALQRFFVGLSVFRGGWTVEAAVAVCEEPLALDYLAQLRECSLVLAEESGEEMRFRMLETLREFGQEQMTSEERTTAHQRHLDFFLRLAEEAERQWEGSDQAVWSKRLEIERDNLWAALEGSKFVENGAEMALRMAAALWGFWNLTWKLKEGSAYLAEALSREEAQARTSARAKALMRAAWLAEHLSDEAAMQSFLEEAEAIYRELGNDSGVRDAQVSKGHILLFQGDFAAARTLFEVDLTIKREMGDRRAVLWALNLVANVARMQGDYTAAINFHREALEIARELEYPVGISVTLGQLAHIMAQRLGDFAAARPLLEESLAIDRELGRGCHVIGEMNSLGWVVCELGDYAAARTLLEEGLAKAPQMDGEYIIPLLLFKLGDVALCEQEVEAARSYYQDGLRQSQMRSHWVPKEWGVAVGLGKLAGLAPAERAARLYGAYESLCETVGFPNVDLTPMGDEWDYAIAMLPVYEDFGAPVVPAKREEYLRRLAAVRTALGEDAFAAAWEVGRAMTMAQAVAYALEETEIPPTTPQ